MKYQANGIYLPHCNSAIMLDKHSKLPTISIQSWKRCILMYSTHMPVESNGCHLADNIFKNVYEFLNLRALIISTFYKSIIFQCMGKILCVSMSVCVSGRKNLPREVNFVCNTPS